MLAVWWASELYTLIMNQFIHSYTFRYSRSDRVSQPYVVPWLRLYDCSNLQSASLYDEYLTVQQTRIFDIYAIAYIFLIVLTKVFNTMREIQSCLLIDYLTPTQVVKRMPVSQVHGRTKPAVICLLCAEIVKSQRRNFYKCQLRR